MANDAVFKYITFYIFFLISLQMFLGIGLSKYISTTVSVTAPTLTTIPSPVGCSGFWCILGDWGTAIVNFFAYIYYFFQNVWFLVSLAGALNAGAWGVFSLFFTGMTIIFIVCVVDFIKPIGH